MIASLSFKMSSKMIGTFRNFGANSVGFVQPLKLNSNYKFRKSQNRPYFGFVKI